MRLRTTTLAAVAAATLFGATQAALAGATIFNTGSAATASIALGINDEGHLNTATDSIVGNSSRTGVAYKFADGTFRDATSPGCYCEGWGVSVNGVNTGFANVDSDGGANGLSLLSFSSTASTATSRVAITSAPGIVVTQSYSPADNAPGALFKNVVTIENKTGSTVTDVKYVRVMDWDVPLTEFNEFVTIKGTGTTTLLEKSHLDGFASANPLNTGCDAGCGYGGVDTDFTDAGPADHGAYFRFNFGSLNDGESATFTIFYGATASERTALAAIAAEGIELYSLGQSSPPSGDPVSGTPATFIFGFKGVGGIAIETDVPEPASMTLLGVGLAAAAAMRRRSALKA